MLEADFTIPVYQEGDGETKNAAVHFSQLLVAHHDREIQSISPRLSKNLSPALRIDTI